jgi:chemotaxis protein methyltransferase CheR
MNAARDLGSFVSARTGIELTRGGVDRALAAYAVRREHELGVTREAYLAHLGSESGNAELERLVNSITVGYTWFFRDPGQLAAIEALVAGELARPGRVRLWVPGCSTGEDAYSLAFIADHVGREVEILATDLNTQSLEQARRGIYGAWTVRDLDPRFGAHFTRRDKRFEVSSRVRESVTFARHNLVDRPPVPRDAGSWHIVLCRNVLIYFEREVALRVLETLARALAPGGYLVLGASEVVCEVPSGLQAAYVAGRLVFRRIEPTPSASAGTTGTFARDWFDASPTPAPASGLVAAFPATGDVLRALTPPALEPPLLETSDIERDLATGHRRIESGDVVGARSAYLDALRRDPTRADVHLYAGVARYLCGELEPAAHELRAALFLDDGLWPAAFYLALCHENGGHPAEALQAYEHVLRVHDRRPASHETSDTVFDAWRDDLSAVARRRVQAATAEARRAG